MHPETYTVVCCVCCSSWAVAQRVPSSGAPPAAGSRTAGQSSTPGAPATPPADAATPPAATATPPAKTAIPAAPQNLSSPGPTSPSGTPNTTVPGSNSPGTPPREALRSPQPSIPTPQTIPAVRPAAVPAELCRARRMGTRAPRRIQDRVPTRRALAAERARAMMVEPHLALRV